MELYRIQFELRKEHTLGRTGGSSVASSRVAFIGMPSCMVVLQRKVDRGDGPVMGAHADSSVQLSPGTSVIKMSKSNMCSRLRVQTAQLGD